MAATLETPEQRSIARRRYTEEEIERGLLVLALNGGRVHKASQELAHLGHTIPHSTLTDWRDGIHADRYAQLAADAQAKVRERVAAAHERVVFAATDHQLAALDQFRTHLDHGNIPRDKLAGDIRNLATVAGINADKANIARDRPTQVVEHRGSDELYAAMKGMGIDVIDGEAQEIQDAEEVPSLLATSAESAKQRAPKPA